jgi:hypothetical protein
MQQGPPSGIYAARALRNSQRGRRSPQRCAGVLGPSATSGLDYQFLAEKAPGTDTHV